MSSTVFIGIDWADQSHAVAMLHQNKIRIRSLDQNPEAIEQWALALQKTFPGQRVVVCLEQSKGALIYALMKYDFLELVPINPSQLSSYRDTLKTSGAKDDPTDAALLAQFAAKHPDQLQRLVQDDASTRYLRALCEDRRGFVNRRTAVTNALKSRLKQYFPQVLAIFKKLKTELASQFLQRWNSLAAFQQANWEEVETLVATFGGTNSKAMLSRMKKVHQGCIALIQDEAIINSGSLLVKSLATELKALSDSICEYDAEIKQVMVNHEDRELFESLPGAGPALAPRLLVAFGSQRERFGSAQEIQQLSGIAPVLKRSGRSVQVRRRLACNHFLRQTFHEFAAATVLWCPWAKAFYDLQRDRGKRHHAAIRSLAYKWIRIIFRCWKSKTKFDEFKYTLHVCNKNPKLKPFMKNDEK